MSPQQRIAIPFSIFIPVLIALGAWQWGLNKDVTENKVKVETMGDDFKEIKTMINQNYLMTKRQLDSIAQDVNRLNVRIETKVDKRWDNTK